MRIWLGKFPREFSARHYKAEQRIGDWCCCCNSLQQPQKSFPALTCAMHCGAENLPVQDRSPARCYKLSCKKLVICHCVWIKHIPSCGARPHRWRIKPGDGERDPRPPRGRRARPPAATGTDVAFARLGHCTGSRRSVGLMKTVTGFYSRTCLFVVFSLPWTQGICL